MCGAGQEWGASRVLFAGKPIWLANDYETVARHIASDEILSAPAAYEPLSLTTVGRVLPTMSGTQHRLNRAIVSRVFFPGKMREYAESLFADEARRQNPKDDVISLLTRAEVDGKGLSNEEVLAFCRNLFPAAIDTSTNSLGSLIRYALEDRELWGAPALRSQAPRSSRERTASLGAAPRDDPPALYPGGRAWRSAARCGRRCAPVYYRRSRRSEAVLESSNSHDRSRRQQPDLRPW